MQNHIRLPLNIPPTLLPHPQPLLRQIPNNDLHPSLLHPRLLPHTPILTALPQPLHPLLRVRRTDVADDFGDARATAEEVPQDERAEEARGACEEDGERFGGKVGGERVV
jgi:hypothetical protein